MDIKNYIKFIMAQKIITFQIGEKLSKRLEDYTDFVEMNRSVVIRLALQQFLDQFEKQRQLAFQPPKKEERDPPPDTVDRGVEIPCRSRGHRRKTLGAHECEAAERENRDRQPHQFGLVRHGRSFGQDKSSGARTVKRREKGKAPHFRTIGRCVPCPRG